MTAPRSAPVSSSDAEREPGRMPRNVLALGLVSLLADISSEMVYPLLPVFLVAVLGAPVTAIGLIEGIAESTAGLLKAASGWWSDHSGRRLPLVFAGYGLAAVGKILLAFATLWPLVMLARFIDRVGKGIRGTPRDALIADSTTPARRGRAFGLHRSMDTAGAVIGPLLALLLVSLIGERPRLIFLIAAIPGMLSVAALLLVREPDRERPRPPRRPARASHDGAGRDFRLFAVAWLVFAVGNSSDVFLLLRAKDLGLSATSVVLAYVLYKFVSMSLSAQAGMSSDRLGRRDMLAGGMLVFAAVYAGFAVATRADYVWPLFALYGVYLALTDGVSRAFVTDLAPTDRRATVLGAYGTLTSIAALIASIVAGLLWDHLDAAAPFVVGAGCAVIGAVLMIVIVPRHRAPGHDTV